MYFLRKKSFKNYYVNPQKLIQLALLNNKSSFEIGF